MSTATSTPVLDAALAYLAAGLSVIPVGLDGRKQPAFDVLPRGPDPDRADRYKATWKPYQERLADLDELSRWFGGRRPYGIALVCGAVSGGLECIDFDERGLIRAFLEEVRKDAPELFERLSLEETPGGAHVWYRCAELEPNRKLAWPSKRECEREAKKFKCMIETRGEGGYAVVAGSPLEVHETKKPYRHVGGPRLDQVAEITSGERDFLFRLAMSFDREDGPAASAPRGPAATGGGEVLSPGDDYDLRGQPFSELLPDAHFQCAGRDEGKVRRPDKEQGYSATVGHCRGGRDEPLLKVFTTSWPPFQGGKCYGRFQVLRLTRFKGDGAAATRFLREQGYGSKRPPSGFVQAPSKNGAPAPSSNGHAHPSATPRAPEPWDPAIPLDDPADAPPPFPLDAYPSALADLCRDVGETIGCPPDYAATFALATMAGTCGAAVALNVKDQWEEHASLFVCAVAPPNGGKTPSFKILTKPVIDEQSRRYAADDKKPAYVGDITVEKLADVLKQDPRGTLLLRDELAGWVKGMDQYKSRGGSDRQFWLSVWSSDAVSVHRKNPDSPHVFIPHPCVSVAGGIQPEVLKSLRGNDDGFFDRILFTYPAPLPAKAEDWRTCNRKLVRQWTAALDVVRGIDMVSEYAKPMRPRFVELSAGARKKWQEYTATLAGRMNDPEFPAHLAGVAGKLKGYGARLALVSMLLRVAYDQPGGEPGEVTADDMAGGAALATYFLGHAVRVYRAMGRDPRIEPARKILAWIAANKLTSFRRSDVWDALRKGSTFRRPEELADPLWLLTLHRYVRTQQEDAPDGPGRRPTRTYEVNPHLFQRPINPNNPINPGSRSPD